MGTTDTFSQAPLPPCACVSTHRIENATERYQCAGPKGGIVVFGIGVVGVVAVAAGQHCFLPSPPPWPFINPFEPPPTSSSSSARHRRRASVFVDTDQRGHAPRNQGSSRSRNGAIGAPAAARARRRPAGRRVARRAHQQRRVYRCRVDERARFEASAQVLGPGSFRTR